LPASWKCRKSIFGSCAFYPLLSLSGKGCLKPNCVEALKRETDARLPPDEKGRFVIGHGCLYCWKASSLYLLLAY
jgi:hypothetical protein